MEKASGESRPWGRVLLLSAVSSLIASTSIYARPPRGGTPSGSGQGKLQPASARQQEAPPNSLAMLSTRIEPTSSVVKNGLLTYRARNQSLRTVLEEIGEAAGVAVALGQELGDEQVSVEFKDFRLDEALRQLLGGYDVFLYYGAQKQNEAAVLKGVWVYPARHGKALKPEPPEAWASTLEAERLLGNSDPKVRARAMEMVIVRKQEQALPLVIKSLRDESGMVRSRTLDKALDEGLEIPERTLIELALNDRSVNVRFLALEALSDEPTAGLRWVAERAAQDPSAAVREIAREILGKLDAGGKPVSHPVGERQKPGKD